VTVYGDFLLRNVIMERYRYVIAELAVGFILVPLMMVMLIEGSPVGAIVVMVIFYIIEMTLEHFEIKYNNTCRGLNLPHYQDNAWEE